MNRVEWKNRVLANGCWLLAAAAAICVAPSLARADEAAEKQGTALMDKYVTATGGSAAYEAVTSRIIKGQREIADGQVGKFEAYWAKPNKFHSIVEMPPAGALERGSDGETVWLIFPGGVSILSGRHREIAVRDSTHDRFGRWRKIYQKAEYIGDEKVDGVACAKVSLTLKQANPEAKESPVVVYIAKDSGLIVEWTADFMDESAESQGAPEVVVRLGDYRKVGSLTVPHQMKTTVTTVVKTDGKTTEKVIETVVRVDEIVFDAAIPAEKFELPDAVKEELKAKEQNKPKK